ncbi:MAG: lipid A deacylase LpxR family protein [Gammaproteobacteria bacterium]
MLVMPAALSAANQQRVQDSWTASFMFENDLFGDSDQNYTNGIKISWISPDLTDYRDSERLPGWANALVEKLPLINEPGLQRNIAFSIGQKIFTPEDVSRTDLIVDDQPYAGWLFASAAFHNKNERILDTFEIQLGIVGPASFAEDTQRFVHRLRDIPEPQGWNNQLETEPGIVLIGERKQRLWQYDFHNRFGMDFIGHAGIGVGNIHTYANTGVEARFGWNIPRDFGSSVIRPGGDTNAPADSSDPRIGGNPFSAHLFAAITGAAVARNLFLDGNTFSSSHSVDKKHFVGDLVLGASMVISRVKISYAQVFRSREFDQQTDKHEFGSVSLSYTF